MGDRNRHVDTTTLDHLVAVRVEKAELEHKIELLNKIILEQQKRIEELENEISKGSQRNDHAGVSNP